MAKFIKKNSGFFYWAFLPSLLLVISVFGINLIPRPAISLYGSSDCQDNAECTGNPTSVCITEVCDAQPGGSGFCDISAYDTAAAPSCGECDQCGNGACEQALGEDFSTCAADCLTDNWVLDNPNSPPVPPPNGFGTRGVKDNFVCWDPFNVPNGGPTAPGAGAVLCGADLIKLNGSGPIGPALDGCCPPGCQGNNSGDPGTFDMDCPPNFDGAICLNQCGNGIVEAGIGEECEPGVTDPACPTGETCNTTTCICGAPTPTPVPTFPPIVSTPTIEGAGCSLHK